MFRPVLHGLSVCGGVLLLALAARATIVVDAGGGGDVTTLAAAIAAAQEGELILVKSAADATAGTTSFLLQGKNVSIVADVGANVWLKKLQVEGVPFDRQVVLRGLRIDASAAATSSGPALLVKGPGGTIWVEDCTIDGGKGTVLTGLGAHYYPAGPGVQATDGATVVLQRCTIKGADGWNAGSFLADKWNAQAGHAAVSASHSRVVVDGCALQGGDGGDGQVPFAPMFFPPNGGDGLFVLGSSLAHVSGSSLAGGDNGLNTAWLDDAAGSGIAVDSGASTVWVRDSALAPGKVQGDGLPGQQVSGAGAPTVTYLPAAARSFAIDSPLREGQAGTLTVQGQPGDQVLLLVGLDAGALPMPGRQGVLLIDPLDLVLVVPLGAITAPDGHLDLPFVTPAMNPVVTALSVPMQLAVAAGGTVTLEAGSALAWLDAGL